MELVKENTTRKLDSLGRVSIPKSMRDRLGLKDGDEVEFYMLRDGDNNYVALGKNGMVDLRYLRAAEVLDELGLEVPQELIDKCK